MQWSQLVRASHSIKHYHLIFVGDDFADDDFCELLSQRNHITIMEVVCRIQQLVTNLHTHLLQE